MDIKMVFLLLILTSILFSQVNFDYDFSIYKSNPEDDIVRIWFDDVDDNGEDEIYAGYRYSNEWRIITYDLMGEIVSIFDNYESDDKTFYNCTTYKILNSTYFITAFQISESNHNYLDIEIYDFNTLDLIDTESVIIGSFQNKHISDINYITPTIIQDDLIINVGILTFSHTISGEQSITIYETELRKFQFENEILTYVEVKDDCGNSLNQYDGFEYLITTGTYSYSSWVPGHDYYYGADIFIRLLTYEYPQDIIEILHVWGDYNYSPTNLAILSNNNENYLENGFAIFYRQLSNVGTSCFLNYYPDFSDSLWFSVDSEIIDNKIYASTCVTVNDEDHYIMYFSEDQLELRDMTDGQIVHYQDSSISPFSILRKSDGELVFITDQDTYYNLHVLSEEIQVDTYSNLVPFNNYGLENYPNPFNPSTTILFSLPEISTIYLSIYNIRGQKINTLSSGLLNSGNHSILWDGKDQFGNEIDSGLYLLNLNINGQSVQSKKCMFLK